MYYSIPELMVIISFTQAQSPVNIPFLVTCLVIGPVLTIYPFFEALTNLANTTLTLVIP